MRPLSGRIPVALLLASGTLLFASACASSIPFIHSAPAPVVDTSSDDDVSEFMAVLRSDLRKAEEHDAARPRPQQTQQRAAFSQATTPEPLRLSRRLELDYLPMPVSGISPRQLEDNFGAPRDGGTRKHRGIDIFAPRGTEIVAVADGYISYIGEQPKGGRCLWLSTEEGVAFYYAHLDRWATGLYEGMEVRKGTLLGFVGTTGNAAKTPPHLHFAVLRDDEALNPYPLLRGIQQIPSRRDVTLSGGFASGGK